MLNYWDRRNRVESQPLLTEFATEYVTDELPVAFYRYTRTRTKSYSYIGLDRATAIACANAMNEKYTRLYRRWEWKSGDWRQVPGTDGVYREKVATAVPKHDEGGMYSVDVQVNEVCIANLRSTSMDLDQTFRFYFGDWDYDED